MREEYTVKPVTRNDIKPYIIDIHYAKRMPSVSYRFDKNNLKYPIFEYPKENWQKMEETVGE